LEAIVPNEAGLYWEIADMANISGAMPIKRWFAPAALG
jgi:hypothetical protein